jgi:hypothetical protein
MAPVVRSLGLPVCAHDRTRHPGVGSTLIGSGLGEFPGGPRGRCPRGGRAVVPPFLAFIDIFSRRYNTREGLLPRVIIRTF